MSGHNSNQGAINSSPNGSQPDATWSGGSSGPQIAPAGGTRGSWTKGVQCCFGPQGQ